MLELYHHNISVCAQKVRLSFYEKGLRWEGRHVDLMTAEQVSPAYLALNPKGVVPTIVHDGNPVIESTIILEYLENAFPETPCARTRRSTARPCGFGPKCRMTACMPPAAR